jgi:hypothetical protein
MIEYRIIECVFLSADDGKELLDNLFVVYLQEVKFVIKKIFNKWFYFYQFYYRDNLLWQ